MVKEDTVENFYSGYREAEDYEDGHSPRYDFLVEDLKLYEIENSKVADFGCGLGSIFGRLPQDKGNDFHGFDGSNPEDVSKYKFANTFTYHQQDLNLPFADKFLEENNFQFDIGMSFETWEHIPNLYQCIVEIKKLIKKGGTIYISIPHENMTHNTFYPGLLYPVENFANFLAQMSLEIKDHTVHRKAHTQHVFTLENHGWDKSRMYFHKSEEKFRNIPPLVAINL